MFRWKTHSRNPCGRSCFALAKRALPIPLPCRRAATQTSSRASTTSRIQLRVSSSECRSGRYGIDALRAAAKTSAMASASLGSARRSERAGTPRNVEIVAARKRDEPVRLTRIYTGGGDRGETSLGDGSRVSKLDCRIGAFGTVDELNAQIGVALAGDLPEPFRRVLERVQNELFDVGADLSVPWGVTDRLRVEQPWIERLEDDCDRFNAELPELRSFVLPGGTEAAARLHVARTVCRRAEREVLLAGEEVELNPLVLVYLNRLSDLLFILARAANAAAGVEEPLWKPGASR